MDDRKKTAVNEWKSGRKLWTCQKCGKSIWLESTVYERAYKGQTICLDCRQKPRAH